MVEAALGVCQLADRIPDVQTFFVADLHLIHTRIENEVGTLYHCDPVCNAVSAITNWGTSDRVAPKFDFSFEAQRDFRRIVPAPAVWSDSEVEVDEPQQRKPATARRAQRRASSSGGLPLQAFLR